MSIYTLQGNQYSQTKRVESLLDQLCAGSATASKLLRGKTVNLVAPKKGSTGGHAKGNEICVDFLSNAREMAESVIFEASNAALRPLFRANENAFKQHGTTSLREYARKKAKIEYNSTTAVAMVLWEMDKKKSDEYVASTWGTKQRKNYYLGAQAFANAPHDNRPEQTDPIKKLPTWEMYAYEIIAGTKDWKIPFLLKKMANLECKKYFERDDLRSVSWGTPVTAEHILKGTRVKNSLVLYPSYIALLGLLQKDPDWTVDMKGKDLKGCQFTEKMLFEAKKINPNAGRASIFPRVVTNDSGFKVVLHER